MFRKIFAGFVSCLIAAVICVNLFGNVVNAWPLESQPSDYYGPPGSTAIFKVEAGGTEEEFYECQWYINTSGTWKECTYNGAKTDTLSFTVTSSMDGYQFKCIVSHNPPAHDGYLPAFFMETSDTVVLHVTEPLTITKQPDNYTGDIGGTAVFQIRATGESLKCQWQEYKNNTWVNSTSTGNATATFKVSIRQETIGRRYRCVITDKYGNSVISNEVTIIKAG